MRKFACFAIGNVGFHNDRLYNDLKPVLPSLVDLLKDDDEKIRANAAGALGNFVRNSSVLTKDLIKHNALMNLLDLILNDKGPVFRFKLEFKSQKNSLIFYWKFMYIP